jgi:hypothetical protein
MSRLSDLQARRRRLLARCELQRAELSERLGEFKDSPLTRVAGEMFGAGDGKGLPPLGRPLTWAAALAGLVLLRRPRQVLTLLMWARAAASLGSRATLILRLLGQLRGARGDAAQARPARRAAAP